MKRTNQRASVPTRATAKPARPKVAGFDADFGTAIQALAALQSGAISSRELTQHVLARIGKLNPALASFVTVAEAQALARARQADAALARKKPLGPLHGLPIVVKDTWATAGLRTTGGSKTLEQHVPKQNAVVVERLEAAGAVIVGKTNLPEWAADWQSFNDVAGAARNPWDRGRTPGGSTGGGAAAVAAGLGFLEIGSDIAGSIRIPAHFCGVYGHKSTWGVVPMRGHIPPPPGMQGTGSELSVAGPLARSAEDLLLELGVVAGPDRDEAVAYRWTLPKPRQARLRDYRIRYVLDDPFCPVDAGTKAVLTEAVAALRKAGARLTEGWPEGVDPERQSLVYRWLLNSFFSQTLTKEQWDETLAARAKGADDPWTRGAAAYHREWLPWTGARLAAREVWQAYFRTHDAFLMPVAFMPAFAHDSSQPMSARMLKAGGGARPYTDMNRWISFATLTGCPATSAPVGRTREGLPVGLQIMGPYAEDATPIDLAAKITEVVGGFEAPPGG
jgi:amidase